MFYLYVFTIHILTKNPISLKAKCHIFWVDFTLCKPVVHNFKQSYSAVDVQNANPLLFLWAGSRLYLAVKSIWWNKKIRESENSRTCCSYFPKHASFNRWPPYPSSPGNIVNDYFSFQELVSGTLVSLSWLI